MESLILCHGVNNPKPGINKGRSWGGRFILDLGLFFILRHKENPVLNSVII